MKVKSNLGLVLSILYALAVVVMLLYSFACSGWFCGIGFILLLLPWVAIFEESVLDSNLFIFFFGLINVVLVYWIGYWLEYIYKKIFKKNNA